MVDSESHRRRRLVKEAKWVRKTKTAIKQDEGNYELPRVCDDVIQRRFTDEVVFIRRRTFLQR